MSLAENFRRDDETGKRLNLKTEVSALAEQDSIVQSFSIFGLYGYRTIALHSDFAATVLIARNGSGKTTMLAILDAFLKCQFYRLRDVDFREIRCKLRGASNELTLTRVDIKNFVDLTAHGTFALSARKIGADPEVLFKFLVEDYGLLKGDYRSLSDFPVFDSIVRQYNYRIPDVYAACDKLRDDAFRASPSIYHVFSEIRTRLRGVEIIYLPTYRRIEMSVAAEEQENPSSRKKHPFRFPGKNLFTGEIQFGLSDIADRLAVMNGSILNESNRGYRKISADIINELIDGSFERQDTPDTAIPDEEELRLFFSRIKEGRNSGPYYDTAVPEYEKIYTAIGLPSGSTKFLRYFLNKLGSVIEATRDIEGRVEAFVRTCNRYLSSDDVSTDILDASSIKPDVKTLCLNRQNLQVFVQSRGRKIPLNSLSSGEKQMISLFAKLYLYPGRKIMLIDEPELSLSIEWQQKILIDVLKAPLCNQIVAITHSPFVFDNDLEPFARSLISEPELNAPLLFLDESETDIHE